MYQKIYFCIFGLWLMYPSSANATEEEDITFTDAWTVTPAISALYLNPKFSDVTFIIDDERIYGHKVILAARCEYFEALLYNSTETKSEITIKHVSAAAFKKLLKFIYTGAITITPSDPDLVEEVLYLAHVYSFKGRTIFEQLERASSSMPLVKDINVATPALKAKVISGKNTGFLLNGNRKAYKYASHTIGDRQGITIQLGALFYINYVKMMLCDLNKRFLRYSYYIEISIDQKKWKKVIDYSNYACGSVQNLYFDRELVRYIRVVGTRDYADAIDGFRLVYFEAYYTEAVPEVVNGIIRPKENVATYDKHAYCIGWTRPYDILDGNYVRYTYAAGYTLHATNKSENIFIHLPQPYLISTMKLLLLDLEPRYYHYYIETSTNNVDWKPPSTPWEMVADCRKERCSSWQHINFTERPVVFVRITGTYNLRDQFFQVVHFEAPAGT